MGLGAFPSLHAVVPLSDVGAVRSNLQFALKAENHGGVSAMPVMGGAKAIVPGQISAKRVQNEYCGACLYHCCPKHFTPDTHYGDPISPIDQPVKGAFFQAFAQKEKSSGVGVNFKPFLYFR